MIATPYGSSEPASRASTTITNYTFPWRSLGSSPNVAATRGCAPHLPKAIQAGFKSLGRILHYREQRLRLLVGVAHATRRSRLADPGGHPTFIRLGYEKSCAQIAIQRPLTANCRVLSPQEMNVEKAYWLSRKRASLRSAQVASSSVARLIHYDLAGRYGVKAASAGTCAHDLSNAPNSPLVPSTVRRPKV
jgi:hypothetical protein